MAALLSVTHRENVTNQDEVLHAGSLKDFAVVCLCLCMWE